MGSIPIMFVGFYVLLLSWLHFASQSCFSIERCGKEVRMKKTKSGFWKNAIRSSLETIGAIGVSSIADWHLLAEGYALCCNKIYLVAPFYKRKIWQS